MGRIATSDGADFSERSRARNLPIEQPTEFELAVNPKTAKAFGITIPQTIMVQATRDRVGVGSFRETVAAGLGRKWEFAGLEKLPFGGQNFSKVGYPQPCRRSAKGDPTA